MNLTKEELQLLIQICNATTVRISDAQVILNLVTKLTKMGEEVK